MKIVVLKFGGTSVGSLERIKKVAKIVATYKKKKLMCFHSEHYEKNSSKKILVSYVCVFFLKTMSRTEMI